MTNGADEVLRGGCLCGAVRFALRGALRPPIACHCGQCRKWSGHFFAATAVCAENFLPEKEDGLRWYRASDTARRGFCGECGCSLLWRPNSGEYVAVAAAALDDDAKLRLSAHIYTADKGGYYGIADGLPQYAGGAGVQKMPR